MGARVGRVGSERLRLWTNHLICANSARREARSLADQLFMGQYWINGQEDSKARDEQGRQDRPPGYADLEGLGELDQVPL